MDATLATYIFSDSGYPYWPPFSFSLQHNLLEVQAVPYSNSRDADDVSDAQ